ncbi:MAG: aminotransferase class I/II-fold pyridoxal phosphate-dependent enzyme [Enhygromyxa sp.]
MPQHLSRRGQRLLAQPPFAPYLLAHFAHSDDEGYIPLCVAENRTMWDVLTPRLSAYRDVPPRVLGYDAMIGNLEFRRKLAQFMSRAFLGRTVAAEQLVALAGAGAVLEQLFYAIADPGDGVLVPTPSYAGFWSDLETRDELRIIPVPCASAGGFALRTEDLDRALASADRPVKALLFTHPDNPLGRVATREQLLEILAWSERAGVHVVFDEVYALSVFGERPFVSAASLRPSLGERAHVVWAFSKDFGASGLRCGVLLSENTSVLQAVDGLSYWAACSGDTQHLLGELVADRPFVDDYLTKMRGRLAQTYARAVAALDVQRIRYIPAEAGIFVLCDLRPYLDEPTFEAEDRLWRRIVDEAKVNLTPGSACRIAEPGFFRLCYAAVPEEAVIEGIARIGRVLGGE